MNLRKYAYVHRCFIYGGPKLHGEFFSLSSAVPSDAPSIETYPCKQNCWGRSTFRIGPLRNAHPYCHYVNKADMYYASC